MSKLRTKQILDFVTDVQAGMENYLTTAASNADAAVLSSAKSYADQAEADGLADAKAYTDARELVIEGEYAAADSVVLSSAKAYADDAESDAISSAKSYTDTRETAIGTAYANADSVVLSSAKSYADQAEADALSDAKVYSDIQKGRIDILLENSDTTLDTFKEISDFLGALDTTDISGLSAMISTGYSKTLSSANSYADQAEADALSDAKAYTDARELVIEGEYATADSVVLSSAVVLDAAILSDAKVYADGLVGGVDYRELEAINVTATTFETTELFDMSVDAEVDVFINGLQIHRYDAEVKEGEKEGEKHGWRFAGAGNKFEIVALGYTLDNVDHVIVSGKLA